MYDRHLHSCIGDIAICVAFRRHGAVELSIGTHVQERDSSGLESDLIMKLKKRVPVLDTMKPITYYAPVSQLELFRHSIFSHVVFATRRLRDMLIENKEVISFYKGRKY